MIDPREVYTSPQLPSFPTAAAKLLELSNTSRPEIADVVGIIRTDPALTARIFKATNSSLFALSSEVVSIDRAIAMLGTNLVISLALGFSLIDESMMTGQLAEEYRAFWMQSIVQAAAAELLGQSIADASPAECFQAGLLMDIGRLAMLKVIGPQYADIAASARDDQRDLVEVEQELLGFTHCDIGEKLAEEWSLPRSLKIVAGFHHAATHKIEEQSNATNTDLLRVAALAAAIGDYFCRNNTDLAQQRVRRRSDAFFGITSDDLDALLDRVKEKFDQYAPTFNVSADDVPPPSLLMAEANLKLSEHAIRAQMETAFAFQRQQTIEQERNELYAQNQQLKTEVLTDPLTGLYNRRYFNEALNMEISRCQRGGHVLGVMFVDVDQFKKFNDTYGHVFADQVLARLATSMQAALRNCDVLARFGGEEFVVLVHETTEHDILQFSERVRSSVEDEKLTFEEEDAHVTVSVGASIVRPSVTDTRVASRLVSTADEAMYESKKKGGNRSTLKSLLNDRDEANLGLVAAGN